jgi:2-polyprenyl-3-methyl-5-hydroxy-6-metoxy-1,4-benzoquinol methylase
MMKTCPDRFDLMLNTALALGISQKTLALDVGCGNGHFCELMLNKGFNVTGLDLDKKSIKMAWRKLRSKQGFHVMLADAQHLPIRAGLFDLVVCAEVIEHLPNPALLLKDSVAALKADGNLLLSTPSATGLFTLLFDRLAGEIRNFISRLFGKTQGYYSGHISLFTYASLIHTLRRFDFVVEREVERWRAEGLISSYLQDSFRRNFDLDLRKHVAFHILKEIDLRIGRLSPQQLRSGWILLCRKNIP